MVEINPALSIGGSIYQGWADVSVTCDIERMAGAFKLSLTEKWPGMDTARAIKPGLSCALGNASDTMVTGSLDAVELSISGDDHTITATGRDKTGDLVDCAAVHKGGEWKDQSIAAIAEDLCKPFGINVIVAAAAANETVKLFKLDEGETVFSAIERLCRIKGLLPTSTTTGSLLLTSGESATSSGAFLKTGRNGNVLTASATFNHAERFSIYTVKGQDSGIGLSDASDANGPKGTATDNGITRYRPLTVIAEETVNAAGCQKRAEWEAAVRRGRARRLTTTVQGWYHPSGIWRPLTLVDCDIPEVNLSGKMLISAVTYARAATEGTTAELALVDPLAFTSLARGEPAGAWGL